jgi:hypothetical protein
MAAALDKNLFIYLINHQFTSAARTAGSVIAYRSRGSFMGVITGFNTSGFT